MSSDSWPGDFAARQADPHLPVAVLLSGGVDSAVALYRLWQAGYRKLTPFYLKIWLQQSDAFLGHCPWEEDLHYADLVASSLGLQLRIEPLQQEYYQQVVSYTLDELRAGRTPSPDLLCNSTVKFGAFVQRLQGHFAYIASGHYANLLPQVEGVQLHRSPDPVKDQSYFLARLRREQLQTMLLPLAGLHKTQVRQLALQYRLPNAQRPDSQGICFLGKLHYPDFIRHHLGEKIGPIIDQSSGKVLGQHQGYWFYTIGQRQGLGLSGGPWYVCGKRVADNSILVRHAAQAYHPNQFEIEELHELAGPLEEGNYQVKLRHGPQLHPCQLTGKTKAGKSASSRETPE